MWHVSSCSSVAALLTAIHLLLTYLRGPVAEKLLCVRGMTRASSVCPHCVLVFLNAVNSYRLSVAALLYYSARCLLLCGCFVQTLC